MTHPDLKAPTAASGPAVADVVRPLVRAIVADDAPVRFEFWDGSEIPADDPVATIRLNSPDAVRRVVWMPNELGLGRAYVAGDLDVEGDVFSAVQALRDHTSIDQRHAWKIVPSGLAAARALGALGRPLPLPEEEAQLGGWRAGIRHSLGRDSKAVRHHYDVGNEFYRLVLGPTMTYSCARFVDPSSSLDDAQTAKHDLVCRKLGLDERPGMRLLDVGCGWGSMAIHAATQYDARVVGVTISPEQAQLARQRVAAAGAADRVEIRVQDYRELAGETFDAVSSIGMSEHVGHRRIDQYFEVLRSVLVPEGRLLNHAISSVGGSRMGRKSFIGRYVFPDGELIDIGDVVLAMERAGFEVRDVESLREHYALTLRQWVANLEAEWDRAVELVGLARAKVWQLYMAASAVGFEDGGISLHQVLGVVPGPLGSSAMPATRRAWG
ncbi:MAG: cyclopropane-fatty-acyl-phospholipid synthase family protein [Actinomycetota bacterium]|nr:cyclopropane-fatty-acyl-phospholipid synthase family protein [Actinomycetota bacterium]